MRAALGKKNDVDMNRRSFLCASTVAAGGLLVSLYLDFPAFAQEGRPAPPPKVYPPDAFVQIGPDGKIVIQVNRLEFGQGVQTSLPMILADELDADWSQVEAQLAPAAEVYKDPMFGIQMVGGSGSIAHSFQQYRELGAKTRAMLISVAADRWKVPPEQCRTEQSVVRGPGGQSAKYAELAKEAAGKPVPATVRLKNPSEFKLVGKRVRRLDSRSKCDGSLKFGLDLELPAMKVAVVAHPPVFGAKVKRFDDKEARALEGVREVFEIPVLRGGTGVAVVADKFWVAKLGRDRLKIEWDVSTVDRPDTSRLLASYKELARTAGFSSVARGDAKAIEGFAASSRIVAEYEFPYLPHAPMEPLNTTVRYDGDQAEVWAGSQFQTIDQMAVAQVLGIKPEQVRFHTEMAGGGFGRRATPDSHVQREAAEIAKRLRGTPVKLIWTREDDIKGGYYRPMHVHRAEIAIGSNGMPAAWRHVVVGQSLLADTPFAVMMKDNIDPTTVEGVNDTHYAIPIFHVSVHHPKVNVPVLWWRSVGHTHSAFVMETLIEELATRARIDPIAYRRKLLKPEAKKLHSALNLLEAKSAWRRRLPRGHAVGFACHESFGTGVACAVDVSIEDKRPRIHRATVAVDCGLAVNPLSVESQFEAGLAFGLSQLMANGAVTLRDGVVEQSNFDGYVPPYMPDAPVAVDVHIVPSTEAPTGCGEPPVPVISPAVVNALTRLTGKHYRSLPLVAV